MSAGTRRREGLAWAALLGWLPFRLIDRFSLVDDDTTAVSTVHGMQVVEADVPTTPQDVPMDWLVTPERSIRTDGPDDKPDGIAWERLDEEKIEEIPILQRLRPES